MKSLSKTPSPKKDRIYGSKVNPKGSASSDKSASAIKLDAKTIASLTTKLNEFKETHNTNKVSLNDLKAVYRRGLGAYSSSHRPTISGGKPNSRNAWAMARVNAFLRKASGGESKKAYVQDDDLLKYHLGGDMSKHLAPNGKPSNLTHEQWHMVRTPEFKAWFGDWEKEPENSSKVVDDNGEPLVVYHGTSENFSIFDKNKISKQTEADLSYLGFFFTDSKKVAIGFTKENFFEKKKRKGAKVLECFLNIRKIKRYTIYQIIQSSLSKNEILKEKNILLKNKFDGVVIDKAEDDWEIELKEFDGQQFICFEPNQIKLADGTNTNFDANNPDIRYAEGGKTDDHDETYKKWRSLVNMSYGEVKKFYDSKEGKEAGLSSSEANKQGISNGRESARWVMKMKTTPKSEWTPTMWKWANKQISFISRMSGNQGDLYDDKGNKTRKHTSLLIWGHNPKKSSSMKYENGGVADVRMEDTVQRMDDPNFADISFYKRGGKIDWTQFYMDGGMNKTCERFDKNGERNIDMKSIDELTYCVNKLPQTKEFHFHDGQYDADRKRLHKEIIYNIKKNLVCVESDKPIAILMGGSPASGKSTFLKKYRPYLLEDEILKIDADEIRSKLPEYKGFNATQTHLETKDIVNLLLSDRNIGIPCRFDLIYDGTMNNTKSYLPLIALLKSLGYKIFVVYIDKVPKDVIEHRALERYKKSGRFVPLEVIDDFFSKGKSALNEIKKEVDGYMIVDGSDSNYHVIERGGMQLPRNRKYSKIGEPIKITTDEVVREYKRGGELNPDDPKIKNEVVHKSGKVGGMLVGQRHSEGGIKAINKSTNQPLEMEGGEVVITRNAVSDDKKRMFEGKMMTNREILSKINESGGGVSFAKGGNVKAKDDCGCGGYEGGGNVKDMKQQYPKDFAKGVREETREHKSTFGDLKKNKISLKEASELVVAKHLSEKPNYYKNYKHGGYLTIGDKQLPSLDTFVKSDSIINSPFVGDTMKYRVHHDAESIDHKFHNVDGKKGNPISNLLAYETYLYDNFGILFSKLPMQVQNALTLGKQALIDNYINS